jgi:phosphoribosylamine--glycine ligase
MKVLVLGSGAKEHAVAWWFSRSHFIEGLYVAPGNIGTETIAKNLAIDPADFDQVYKACKEYGIQYVFIGTEKPLFTGMVDKLNEKGIETFGASTSALKLEGDRNFSRNFTDRHNIPTPTHMMFDNESELSAYLRRHEGTRFVMKSNSVAPSRIMVDSSDYDSLIGFARTMLSSGAILLEEHLSGLSVTITAMLDNNGYLLMPFCSDYMKTESKGIPTGGMGSVCPVPLEAATKSDIEERIIKPTLYGMKVERLSYKGVLTFSVIITKNGPILVDYHVRFNDPAAQAFIPLVKSDLIDILHAMKTDSISSYNLQVSQKSSVALVIASAGYPQEPQTGKILEPMPAAVLRNSFADAPLFFFGGVERKDGQAVTTSGRCVTVVGSKENIIQSNKQAYLGAKYIKFPGAWFRDDIGDRFFEN